MTCKMTAGNAGQVAAFIREGGAYVIFGELVSESEDSRIELENVLIRAVDMRTQDGAVQWMRPPAMSRESRMLLDTRGVSGFLVKNIDSEDLDAYRKAFSKIYSKLYTV